MTVAGYVAMTVSRDMRMTDSWDVGMTVSRDMRMTDSWDVGMTVGFAKGSLTSKPQSSQMDDIDITPASIQIFRHKPAMAMLMQIFAAQQTSILQNIFWNRLLYLSLFNQL